MVRLKQLSTDGDDVNNDLPYAGWMGARHMSALETSTRAAVSVVVTLSEEDGRVTIFSDGTFTEYHCEALWNEWRSTD
jgi:DNA integrity scanning protein DisA with diadenylate cyclase activity